MPVCGEGQARRPTPTARLTEVAGRHTARSAERAALVATTALLISLLYLSGWLLTRGANLQKYVAKTRPQTTGWLGMPMYVYW